MTHRSLYLSTILFCGLITLVTGLFSSIHADSKTPEKRNAAALSPSEREATAISFAKTHHAELSLLLNQLKEMDEKKYLAAINELFRTQERLARYQERTPARYQTELEVWKIDSRVRLLVARSVSGMEEETRQQIKSLLTKRNELRLKQLMTERDRLEDRMQRLDEQISSLNNEEQSDALAERDLDRLMRSVQSRSTARKKKSSTRSTPAIKKNESTRDVKTSTKK